MERNSILSTKNTGDFTDQKTVQQKAMQLQMHREQAKQIQQQIMQFQQQLNELEGVKESIRQLEKEKEGSDALIPLGAGIFLSGKIGNPSSVLVSAGAGIVVRKTAAEAIAFLDDKTGILKKAMAGLDAEMKKIGISAQAISSELGQYQ